MVIPVYGFDPSHDLSGIRWRLMGAPTVPSSQNKSLATVDAVARLLPTMLVYASLNSCLNQEYMKVKRCKREGCGQRARRQE